MAFSQNKLFVIQKCCGLWPQQIFIASINTIKFYKTINRENLVTITINITSMISLLWPKTTTSGRSQRGYSWPTAADTVHCDSRPQHCSKSQCQDNLAILSCYCPFFQTFQFVHMTVFKTSCRLCFTDNYQVSQIGHLVANFEALRTWLPQFVVTKDHN